MTSGLHGTVNPMIFSGKISKIFTEKFRQDNIYFLFIKQAFKSWFSLWLYECNFYFDILDKISGTRERLVWFILSWFWPKLNSHLNESGPILKSTDLFLFWTANPGTYFHYSQSETCFLKHHVEIYDKYGYNNAYS